MANPRDLLLKKFDNCFCDTYHKFIKFNVIVPFFSVQVLQQQTEAIARLGSVLKRDIRDMEIMMAEDTGTIENGN